MFTCQVLLFEASEAEYNPERLRVKPWFIHWNKCLKWTSESPECSWFSRTVRGPQLFAETVHQTSGEACFDGEWEVAVFCVTSFEEMMVLVVVRCLTECWERYFKMIVVLIWKRKLPPTNWWVFEANWWDMGISSRERGNQHTRGGEQAWWTGNQLRGDGKHQPGNRKWDPTDGKRKQPTRAQMEFNWGEMGIDEMEVTDSWLEMWPTDRKYKQDLRALLKGSTVAVLRFDLTTSGQGGATRRITTS